ncbi:unnamed protein product [Calypogeia fissa]
MMINSPHCEGDKRRKILSVKGAIFWAPPTTEGYLKLMTLSSALNQESKTNMESSQFLILAKQVWQVWEHHGSPANDSSNNKNIKWKEFYNATAVIIPYVDVKKKPQMRFNELAPFLFEMSKQTFTKYMKILDKSRVGELIAFNGMPQKEVIDRSKDWTAWKIPKKTMRDLQGCSDMDLDKLATHLLKGTKVSLTREKPKHSSWKPKISGKFITIEQYCKNKKMKGAFEVACLQYIVNREKSKALFKLEPNERRQQFLQMMTFYQLTKQKIKKLRLALGKAYPRNALIKKLSRSRLKQHIPQAFRNMVRAIRRSVDKDGNARPATLHNQLQLQSFPDLTTKGFLSKLDKTFLNTGEFLFFYASILNKAENAHNRRFFSSFIQLTVALGKSNGHVLVVVANPYESYLFKKELSEHPWYIFFTTQYTTEQSKRKAEIDVFDT